MNSDVIRLKIMKSYTDLFAQLKNANDSWEFVGPQPVSRVDDVERKYNITLPTSFRNYLIELGGIEFLDAHYTSIDDNYLDDNDGFMCNTNMTRNQCDIPGGLIALEYDHDSDRIAFLDLNQLNDGECPVFWYNPFTGDSQGKCADSFDQYFRRLVSEWVTVG